MALDANTGKKLWNYKTAGQVMPTPVIYKDKLYIVTGDRHLYSIDKETGDLAWKLELKSYPSMSSPNLFEGSIYFGAASPYKFISIDLNERSINWETHFPEVVSGLDDVPPAIYDGKYVITTALTDDPDSEKKRHAIYALDIVEGQIVWQRAMGVGDNVANNKSGAPIVYGTKVFVASPITKNYYAYEIESGELVWKYDNGAVAKAPPVAYNDTVYFVDTNGVITALDTDHGDVIGEMRVEGKLAPAGPLIKNGNLIVGSQSGRVYIISLAKFEE